MDKPKELKIFSPLRIGVAISIGLVVAAYMLYSNFDAAAFLKIKWTYQSTLWLLFALLLMGVRDLAYMYRIRVLTDNALSWKSSLHTILLWEFASAITPSVVGGSGVAIYFINKEGLSLGKSTAVVMITALLDELFYVLMVPIMILLVGTSNLFPIELQKEILGLELSTKGIFIAGYLFIFLLTLLIAYAIFIRPRGSKWILLQLFKLPFLRKWRKKVALTGDEIIATSKELKGRNLFFWLKAFLATFLSWTARYWVVNCLILVFVAVDNHMLVYARQLVMWVIMLISPTPGGAGVAEFAFSAFLQDFIPVGIVGAIILLWRLVSYYSYLFIGAYLLPKWVKKVNS